MQIKTMLIMMLKKNVFKFETNKMMNEFQSLKFNEMFSDGILLDYVGITFVIFVWLLSPR